LGTAQDESNMKEEEEREVTEKSVGEIGLKPVVRGTHDAETESVTIEENGVVNCEVEREKKSVKPIISGMVDSIKNQW